MNVINYIKGDATLPISEGNKVLVHICNDIGGWGKGFVMAISKRWDKPELKYREWYNSQIEFELGKVQFVQVEDELWVANLIGQHKIVTKSNGVPPIRYDEVKKGIEIIKRKTLELNASIHMPRIGCGLAGGKWELIEPILTESLILNEIEVTVYDF